MGLFFKSKYDKLTREEVVEAICQLEKESQDMETGLEDKQKKIDELMAKGRTSTDQQLKLLYAKKINAIKAEREQDVKRIMYLMYNTQMLQKLKNAIDDNRFFKNSSKMSLGNLLADQKGLAKFLNKTLNTRINAEDVLTSADETFREIEEAYEQNDTIYGMNSADDALLAMFETEDAVADEQAMYETETSLAKKETGD